MGQEKGRHHPLVGWVDVVMGRFGIYGAGDGSHGVGCWGRVGGRFGIYGAEEGSPSSIGGWGWVQLMWLWVTVGSVGVLG